MAGLARIDLTPGGARPPRGRARRHRRVGRPRERDRHARRAGHQPPAAADQRVPRRTCPWPPLDRDAGARGGARGASDGKFRSRRSWGRTRERPHAAVRRRPRRAARRRARCPASRRRRRTSTGSPTSTRRPRVPARQRRTTRWPRRADVDARRAAGEDAARARRRADRGQGRRRHQGPADDRRLEDPRGLGPAVRRDARRADQGRGPADPRQDQHGRVRDGLVHRALRVRQHPQPVGPRPDPRRLRRRRPPRRSPRTRRRWRSAPTPAARSASRPPSPARSASSRRTAACPAYGLIALASSLDQAGPVHAHGARLGAAARAHRRSRPARLHVASTSRCPALVAAARQGATGDLTGVRVGVVRELQGEGYQPGVLARFEESLELLRGAGAEIVEVSCPHFTYALARVLPDPARRRRPATWPSSTACASACASSPPRAPSPPSASWPPPAAQGFGDEVKRRIILGTYALSAGLLRRLLRHRRRRSARSSSATSTPRSRQADVLVSPTAPTTAFKLGEKLDDPLAMYLNDVATIPANLAGVPGCRCRAACPTTACRSGSRCWPRPRPTTGCTGWVPRSRRCWRTSGAGRCWLRLRSWRWRR